MSPTDSPTVNWRAKAAGTTDRTPRALTARERSTLQAAVLRVLPSTDGPGAREADAMAFIDWIVTQPCFDDAWRCLLDGIRLLEASALSQYSASFQSCSATAQDALLAGLTVIPHSTVRRFFAILVRLTVLGFVAPPGYPGNRGGVGFRYMGFCPNGR